MQKVATVLGVILTSSLLIYSCNLNGPGHKAERRRLPPGSADSSEVPPTGPEEPKFSGEPARGGVIDGNGGELIVTERNPWFTGTEDVLYCIISSDDFSPNRAQISEIIKNVFATWKTVFSKINHSDSSPEHRTSNEFERYNLSINFKETDCGRSPPLVFKLGVRDEEVKLALQFSAVNTIGFSRRTSYDNSTGRSKGFVWLAPDKGGDRYQGPAGKPMFWSYAAILHNVLSHEIGHLFGIQHTKGSIMDEGAPAKIVEKATTVKWMGGDFISGGSIDSERPFCGKSVWYETEPDFIKSIWDISGKDVEICMTRRDDLRENDDSSPLLLELKRAGSVLVSQRISIDGQWISSSRISGSYFSTVGNTQAPHLKERTFVFLASRSLSRGSFPGKDGQTQFIEIEFPAMGILMLRFPMGDKWQALLAFDSEFHESIQALSTIANSW
jgi:hypothetical protein